MTFGTHCIHVSFCLFAYMQLAPRQNWQAASNWIDSKTLTYPLKFFKCSYTLCGWQKWRLLFPYTVQVHLNYDKLKRNEKAIASFRSSILKIHKETYCKINMETYVLLYKNWLTFFYVTWPLRTWIITDFHDFLWFVDLSKVCIFKILFKPCSANKLGWLFNVTCFSRIP